MTQFRSRRAVRLSSKDKDAKDSFRNLFLRVRINRSELERVRLAIKISRTPLWAKAYPTAREEPPAPIIKPREPFNFFRQEPKDRRKPSPSVEVPIQREPFR